MPYFSFTSERGSPCRNNLSGYTCTPLTLADLEFYGDVDLPDDSRMISGTYTATHDYQLDATLDVPAASAKSALDGLKEAYGDCQKDYRTPLDTKGLAVCVCWPTTTRAGQPRSPAAGCTGSAPASAKTAAGPSS